MDMILLIGSSGYIGRKFSIELEKRGFTKEDIEKILGGNWLRLLKDVWE